MGSPRTKNPDDHGRPVGGFGGEGVLTLMFAQLESSLHRWRRRLSRSEWAIRHLGLTPSTGTSEEPGLLIIQIDGLARSQLERAIEKGRMPFLRRLGKNRTYELHTFYPGIPTTTAAVQAELFYGVRTGVPAFSFFRRDRAELGRMLYPTWAKDFEAGYAERAPGLLRDGASWSNIYTGGASQNEAHFCAASNGLGDMWQTGKIRNIFIFFLLQFPAVLRIAGLLLLEAAIALWDAFIGIWRGQSILHELFVAGSRVFVSIGLRELVTMGAAVDVARGLPIVHVNFLGYDEQSHGRGPGSLFAHWCLRGIDRSIKELYRAAHRSSRRDYAVWIISDHGQERTRSFDLERNGGIEAVVRDCFDSARKRDRAWRARSQRRHSSTWMGPWSERRLKRIRAHDVLTAEEQATFTVVAVGPVGHVYFAKPLDDEQREALARRLVNQGQVPGVLVKRQDGRITWFHAKGATAVPAEVPAMLPHPEPMRAEIAKDLVKFCAHRDAGDLILLGWSPGGGTWTFAPERGAHGGVGTEETQGFAFLPVRTVLPPGTKHFIRPSALRLAALHHIGRETLERLPREIETVTTAETPARIMTYNVHGCSGMDGRISPRRVARIILAEAPDIVALQEIDLGRRRSRTEDQAAIIARLLGMNHEFCPTVTIDNEHYGHAVFSPWPMEVVKRVRLPAAPSRARSEPRAALWVRVNVAGRTINVITTHLGLGWNEGLLQVQALLGDELLGSIPEEEPAILCGDFNQMPGTEAYRKLIARMRDSQRALRGHVPRKTFSSLRPFMRIDHVMLSPHFAVNAVQVPRNDLTRVASDHLPLLVDLRVLSASAGTPTTTRPESRRHKAGSATPVRV